MNLEISEQLIKPYNLNDNQNNIDLMSKDRDFLGLSNVWNRIGIQYKYAHNFSWLGIPIIQVPQDIYAMQELIWKVKPYLIIETGIAHGGSLIMSASMLAILEKCFGIVGQVIGIDIEIRQHNRIAIDKHPLSNLITMIEGSSISNNVIEKVRYIAEDYINKNKNIMVFLDSNHTHDHVLSELVAYGPLVSIGSYIVVWDSGIEELPEYMNGNTDGDILKTWRKGNNPKTAVHEYLKGSEGSCFEIDKELETKLMITSVSDGFLKRIR